MCLVAYSTRTFTTFPVNTESTYDWSAHQWSVPINFQISQLLKVGKQPITLQLGPHVPEMNEPLPDYCTPRH